MYFFLKCEVNVLPFPAERRFVRSLAAFAVVVIFSAGCCSSDLIFSSLRRFFYIQRK